MGMKETLNPREKFNRGLLKISWKDIYEPSALRPSVVMMFNTFCFGVVVSLFPDFSKMLEIENKGIFFVYFVVASMASRIIGGKLSDKFGRVSIILISLLIVAVGCVFTGLSTTPTFFFIGGVIFGTGYGMASPSLFAWVIDRSPDEIRGRALSTIFLSLEIGIGLGAFVSGILYQSVESRLPWLFTGSASLTIVAFLYLLLTQPQKT